MESTGVNAHQYGLKLSYKRIFQIISSRWYWILATMAIAMLVAYIDLSFTPNTYSTEATLKFEDKRSEISELINIRNVYDRNNKLLSEQFVIRSREVLTNAAKQLNYPISFYKMGYLTDEELYPNTPFKITILPGTFSQDKNIRYKVTPVKWNQYLLQYTEGGTEINRTCKVNEIVRSKGLSFLISGGFMPYQLQQPYAFHLNHPDVMMSRINDGLTITENKNTNILTFRQTDQNPLFAADILNAVLNQYINYDQGQKTKSATQTITFIDTLQNRLSEVVSSSGSAFEKFKINSKMLNISGVTNIAIEKLEQLEKQKADLDLRMLRINLLEEQVRKKDVSEAINYDLQEINDTFLSNLLAQFNTLLLKKQSQLSTYKPGSETVSETDNQLQIIRKALANNMTAQKLKNKEAQLYIQRQLSHNKQQLNSIPTAEKSFVNLQSTFDVNQKVYAYLNQKKLEAQISRASITPAATVVNKAMYQLKPIGPVKKNTYKTALLIGLLTGIGLIFLVRALNPYIYNRETVEQLTNTPVIGMIRKFPGTYPRQLLMDEAPKTLFAESVRSARTNISFLAPDIINKVICITSETSGDGKSFTAANLAQSLSMIDKRVIVIAADLRKSMLHQVFNADNAVGLSNYLSGQVGMHDVIIIKSDNLSFIPGGPVPPNPAELLYGHKMTALLEVLKKEYNYIIIDSAPVGLVSDAVPMLKSADVNLFVIRAGLSRYHAATIPERLSKELKLANFHIILNAFEHDKLHRPYYNYGNHALMGENEDASSYEEEYFGGEAKRKWWHYKRFTA